MIDIKETYIGEGGEALYINAAVKSAEYYENVFISDLWIVNQDQYKEGMKPENLTEGQYAYHESFKNAKTIDGSILAEELMIPGSFRNGLFVIILKASGTPTSDTPCGMDNIYTITAVCNIQPLYKKVASTIKMMEFDVDNKQIPDEFINEFIKLRALEVEIKAGNYTQACILYKKYFIRNVKSTIKCNCNG